MDVQTAQSLAQILELNGLKSVTVKKLMKHSLLLDSISKNDEAITLKIRREKKQRPEHSLFYRELEFMQDANRHLGRMRPCMPSLMHVLVADGKKLGCSAIVSIGSEIFSVVSMQALGMDGNDFRKWILEYCQKCGGDFPDDLRELLRQLVGTIADLHSKGMALGGFELSDFVFVPGPEMRILFIEAGHGVLNTNLRKYTKPGVPTPQPGPMQALTAEDMSGAKLKRINTYVADSFNRSPLPWFRNQSYFDGEPCDDNLSVLNACEAMDCRAVAINMCCLLGDGKIDHQKKQALISAQSISDLANQVNCRINTPQRRCMARVLTVLRHLLQSKLPASSILRLKGVQFPILSSEQATLISGNNGLLVPSKEVPELRDEKTGQPLRTADLLLKDWEVKGLKTIAASRIEDGKLVTLYAGAEASGNSWPSRYGLTLIQGNSSSRVDALYSSTWTFERFVRQAQIGHILNSSRKVATTKKKGNVVVVIQKQFRDSDGVLQVPMYACRDIEAGEELVWDYDFKANEGGSLMEDSPPEEEFDSSYIYDEGAETEGVLKVNHPNCATSYLKSYFASV
jgi:hypothetical protein